MLEPTVPPPDEAAVTARRPAEEPCVSCGSPYARWFSSSDGPAWLCPTCATLHGLGCP